MIERILAARESRTDAQIDSKIFPVSVPKIDNDLGIADVGPDTETFVHPNGAKESAIPFRLDLLDGDAILEMSKVLSVGADKYGSNNWRGIPIESHLNHLMMHALAYLDGDTSDDHLTHIMCRAMFAEAVSRGKGIRLIGEI